MIHDTRFVIYNYTMEVQPITNVFVVWRKKSLHICNLTMVKWRIRQALATKKVVLLINCLMNFRNIMYSFGHFLAYLFICQQAYSLKPGPNFIFMNAFFMSRTTLYIVYTFTGLGNRENRNNKKPFGHTLKSHTN